MPQYLPIPATEDFGGLDCTSTPDAVKNMDSPDCRNNDISQPGAEIKRNGMVKQNTSAYTNKIYHMLQCSIKDISYTIYIDSAGNIVTI